MAKTINGKIYSVQTATLLGTWSNGKHTGNLFFRSEALYRTPHGLYFLLRDNGPRSHRSLDEEDDFKDENLHIFPINSRKAKAWAYDKLTVLEYRIAFGVEDDDLDMNMRENMTFALSKDTARRLRDVSCKTGTPMSLIIDDAIEKLFGAIK